MRGVLYYFIAVSVIGALVCIYDKLAAPRGWKRGLRHSELFFKHSGEDVSALRLYIIRGPLLIDAFTGESSGAASLIEFII